MKINILIHTALYFEAKIFIEEFKLKKQLNINNFMFFYNSKNNIALITSTKTPIDIGFAFGHIKALYNLHQHIKIINFGIVGGNFDIGNIYEIIKITHFHNNQNLYPLYQSRNIFELENLTTFDQVNNNYNIKGLYDMEGYYFFKAAEKMTIRENIRLVKIISDNNQDSLKNFDFKEILNKIKEKKELLINYILKLKIIDTKDDEIIYSNSQYSFAENQIIQKELCYFKTLAPILKKSLYKLPFKELVYEIKKAKESINIKY